VHVSETHAKQERIQLHLNFRKFGAEVGKPPGVDEKTTSLADDVRFYIGPDWREEEQKNQLELKSVRCRICCGEHYTMHCTNQSVGKPIPETNGEHLVPVEKKCIPLHRRGSEGVTTPTASDKISTKCLRVSCLSQQEFVARFSRFGKITRIFLPRDFATGEYKGYGYVTFHKRENSEKALEMMDRRGYDNLIMRVAWDERPSARVRIGNLKV